MKHDRNNRHEQREHQVPQAAAQENETFSMWCRDCVCALALVNFALLTASPDPSSDPDRATARSMVTARAARTTPILLDTNCAPQARAGNADWCEPQGAMACPTPTLRASEEP